MDDFEEWWQEHGQFIDSDLSAKDQAEIAFLAGITAASGELPVSEGGGADLDSA